MFTIRDLSTGIFIACLMILFYVVISRMLSENYTTKQEKAADIANWWNENKNNPSYAQYKNEMQKSDVVEYNKVKQMGGNISPEKIEKVIS